MPDTNVPDTNVPATRAADIRTLLATLEYGPAPESAAAAHAWLARNHQRFGVFIAGAFTAGTQHFASVDPANGQALAEIAQATPAQLQAAVDAAAAAQPGWQALGGHARARYLYALARALQRHARLFAVLETLDTGKPIRESRDVDIPLAVRHFYHHAGWAQLLEQTHPGQHALGVVGQIVPWNFPLLMLAWKIAPALACGNTVVFKPAEQTSLTALLFAELCIEIGLPPGVVNVLTGDGEVGRALAAHPGIAKIAFTGSTEVGRAIRRATAGSGRKLGLELGGKSAFLVFADADLDAAVEGVVDSIWFNQGQVCCAGSRLLVHEGTATRLLEKLKARMARIRLGDPLDKSTDMGCLVDHAQWERVSGFVERARTQGAEVWQPGAAMAPAGSCFFAPTLVCGVDSADEIVQHEVFGPVLTVQTFRTPGEAVELANNSRYGLAASVWSESIGLALEIAPRLKAGVIWVNCANQFDAACGFGGYRESGFGREGGREGLREYLQRDSVGAGEEPPVVAVAAAPTAATGAIDRTPKLYIGGRQVRPDGGYSRVMRIGDRVLGSVPEGNRKDLRNAVEAARAAAAWERQSAHGRAQVLYYLAENMDAARPRLSACLAALAGTEAAAREVEASVSRLFSYAAWADKYDGAVHQPPSRTVALAMHEAIGVIGMVAPERMPLLGLVSLLAPAIALGNRVVAVPSMALPLVAAELYALLDTSDVPAGVVNLVTGDVDELGDTLAAHADVDAFWWHCGPGQRAARVEALSCSNLKRTWTCTERDWLGHGGEGPEFLEHAVQVKNVWVPYGV